MVVYFCQTQGMWRQVTEYSRATTRERQIVESILDESLLKYEIDSTQFNVTVPDLLLRECEAEIHRVSFAGLGDDPLVFTDSHTFYWHVCAS